MHVRSFSTRFFSLNTTQSLKLRHDHITDDYKLMALPDLFQDFDKEIARAGCAEKGTTVDNNLW
jgi:hypothetical protein